MISLNSISVIGAGSYGTALAIVLAKNGNIVRLWGYKPEHLKKMQFDRCNEVFLPNIFFPKSLILESNLSKIVLMSQDLLIVVPSTAFTEIIKKIKPYLHSHSRIVWATKGLEKESGRLLRDVVREILGVRIPLGVISGPAFSREMASGLPTTIVVSSTHEDFSEDLRERFSVSEKIFVYKSSDFIGVQLGGVVKNVIAIAVGIFDGIGFGANARILLITSGLQEMIRLGIGLGADSSTFLGLAGLGDLILTCTDDKSRNRRFGIMIGKNLGIKTAQCAIGQIVEGYKNTKELKKLSLRVGVIMPIVDSVYQILYSKIPANIEALSLLKKIKNTDHHMVFS